MKAIWNGKVIAESNDTIVVEGNHYFPPNSIKPEFYSDSEHKTVCPWKGTASYKHIEIEGKSNTNAAWYYPEPKEKASEIKGYIAFWNGVEVTE
jgi:uncharacterized protein (DUF427 family)